MKKSLIIIMVLIFTFSAAFAESPTKSEYERKLEYKRKRIDVVMRSQLVGSTSGYSDSDTSMFRVTSSPEGYTYGTTSTMGRHGETVKFERVSDWAILKGNIRELSDLEFLDIIGNNEKSQWIKDQVNEKNMWFVWGVSTFMTGIVVIVAGSASNPTNASLVTAGSLLTIGGTLITAVLAKQPKHYLHPDFAQEESDKYNIRIKKELNIPIDYE